MACLALRFLAWTVGNTKDFRNYHSIIRSPISPIYDNLKWLSGISYACGLEQGSRNKVETIASNSDLYPPHISQRSIEKAVLTFHIDLQCLISVANCQILISQTVIQSSLQDDRSITLSHPKSSPHSQNSLNHLSTNRHSLYSSIKTFLPIRCHNRRQTTFWSVYSHLQRQFTFKTWSHTRSYGWHHAATYTDTQRKRVRDGHLCLRQWCCDAWWTTWSRDWPIVVPFWTPWWMESRELKCLILRSCSAIY